MFQFAKLSIACLWIQQQFERLPYLGISGYMLIFNSPKHFGDYYAVPRLWVPRYPPILAVPEVPATGEPGMESPYFSARLFGLKNAGFYGRSVTPGCRRRPWGDLVVPTG
ncbi:hypothetical protein ACS0TY_035872 [Phlomoides rotata]